MRPPCRRFTATISGPTGTLRLTIYAESPEHAQASAMRHTINARGPEWARAADYTITEA